MGDPVLLAHYPRTGLACLAYQISTLYLIIFGASWGPENWCVSLTSYITEWGRGRSRQRLYNRQLKVDGNKISFKDQAKKLICNHDKT